MQFPWLRTLGRMFRPKHRRTTHGIYLTTMMFWQNVWVICSRGLGPAWLFLRKCPMTFIDKIGQPQQRSYVMCLANTRGRVIARFVWNFVLQITRLADISSLVLLHHLSRQFIRIRGVMCLRYRHHTLAVLCVFSVTLPIHVYWWMN